MLIGYARVSTERPELQAALDFMRAGDTLVAWKLDRRFIYSVLWLSLSVR